MSPDGTGKAKGRVFDPMSEVLKNVGNLNATIDFPKLLLCSGKALPTVKHILKSIFSKLRFYALESQSASIISQRHPARHPG